MGECRRTVGSRWCRRVGRTGGRRLVRAVVSEPEKESQSQSYPAVLSGKVQSLLVDYDPRLLA